MRGKNPIASRPRTLAVPCSEQLHLVGQVEPRGGQGLEDERAVQTSGGVRGPSSRLEQRCASSLCKLQRQRRPLVPAAKSVGHLPVKGRDAGGQLPRLRVWPVAARAAAAAAAAPKRGAETIGGAAVEAGQCFGAHAELCGIEL